MHKIDSVAGNKEHFDERDFLSNRHRLTHLNEELDIPLESPPLGHKLEQSHVECVEAPNDMEQVNLIAKGMLAIKGTSFEDWKKMTRIQRLEAMQELEILTANVQHRPPCKVRMVELSTKNYGYYDNDNKTISLNSKYLDSSEKSYKESLDTILHEGRHAYQHYNIDVKRVHPSKGDCKNWEENLHSNFLGLHPENYGYQTVKEMGFKRYWMQPVEADARAFATDILNKFNKNS